MLQALALVSLCEGTHRALALRLVLEDPSNTLVRSGVRPKSAAEQHTALLARVLGGLLWAHA